MTEEEIKKAIFDVRLEYELYTPEDKEIKHDEYIKKLNILKKELTKLIMERREKELKMK